MQLEQSPLLLKIYIRLVKSDDKVLSELLPTNNLNGEERKTVKLI